MSIIELPAGIDIHVHFREPGLTDKETMYSGMQAAHKGGIHTVLDMPNTLPVTDTYENLKSKLKLARKFEGLHLANGLTNHAVQTNSLLKLQKINPIFKLFLANSTGNLGISMENLLEGFQILGETDRKTLVIIHAEDPELIKPRYNGCIENEVRPKDAEIKAVEKIIAISPEVPSNLKFHITHVSTPDSAQILIENNISFDVLHKHLFLNSNLVSEKGNLARMNPPLRSVQDQQQLYQMLINEKIPIVASDHAPHTLNDKLSMIAGAPGVQELYLSMIDQFSRNKISKNYLQSIIYEEPKKLLNEFGIPIIEKSIRVNTNKTTLLNQDKIISKSNWSLWQDYEFKGAIIT